MRLRNWKETVEPTIEDTLLDVHPHFIDEPFPWVFHNGNAAWVKVDGKWVCGVIVTFERYHFDERNIWRVYLVRWGGRRKDHHQASFMTGDGNIKPDSPEVRELLRKEGVFI
ncbi:hypothetical protein SERLA73DRAFT_190738 [Serpula lacrymans var. lacrymans S7.3]|uniref:Uncharacterized protein n=2 Tax=Serpula lacrymans var. lacrymans TaxID=341189 RepID=F8QG98_SERL3|nr:uncharacterized protein SERLADRAFT_478808 [Serpula lacrymans var. lacrymans S7.9]EGN92713.1 hypothetical protein SERLA73DRAFT_190738 [Serpula lacrymans var. lacrymans S7.3]EGO19424.1 hypothetical protein SERLADRAFT_478808 [Serpula lacrymans var. lacrymans S7.9]